MTNTDRCQHCRQEIRAIRRNNQYYDALPRSAAACTSTAAYPGGWCPQAMLPVPDELQWLVTSGDPTTNTPASTSPKTDAVLNFASNQNTPFTLDDIPNVSDTTARKALKAAGYRYANRPRGNHFYRAYFPRQWTNEQCRDWLNNDTASGKSTAKIYV